MARKSKYEIVLDKEYFWDNDDNHYSNFIVSADNIKDLLFKNEKYLNIFFEGSLTKDDECSIEVYKNNIKMFDFKLSELFHCCGIIEIGRLFLNPSKLKTLSTLHEDLKVFLDEITHYANGKLLILNTNGQGVSVKYDKALSECKNWELNKKFVNSNTGNTIKVWFNKNYKKE